jgi:predicted nucleic acid-binding protein
MSDRVVDASVFAAAFFAEARAAEAHDLLKGFELHGPELLPYEMARVAAAKTRSDPALSGALAIALETALAARVNLVSVPGRQLLALALATGLSVYDASYLWIARELGCELATFDRQLARAAERESLLAR